MLRKREQPIGHKRRLVFVFRNVYFIEQRNVIFVKMAYTVILIALEVVDNLLIKCYGVPREKTFEWYQQEKG